MKLKEARKAIKKQYHEGEGLIHLDGGPCGDEYEPECSNCTNLIKEKSEATGYIECYEKVKGLLNYCSHSMFCQENLPNDDCQCGYARLRYKWENEK